MTITIEKLITSDEIPTLPEVAIRVIELAQQPEPNFDEMVRVIRADPAIASRIMRTVNSALFGLRGRVTSIEAAVPLLGANLVRTLVLCFSLADHRAPSGPSRARHQRLWRSAILQAVAAESIAAIVTGVDESVWFLGALLQDIGRIALLGAVPKEYAMLMDEQGDPSSLLEAEQRQFGFDHVEATSQMCLRWRLDYPLVDAIKKHHTDVRPLDDQSPWPSDPTNALLPNALRCANLCASFSEALRVGNSSEREVVERALRDGFRIPAESVNELLLDIEMRANEVAALFDIDLGDYVSLDGILDAAQSLLVDLAGQSAFAQQGQPIKSHSETEFTDLDDSLRGDDFF